MKRILLLLYLSLGWQICLYPRDGISTEAYAEIDKNEQVELIELQKILLEFERHYKVTFTYDKNLVKGVRVQKIKFSNENVESNLQTILKGTALAFRKLGDKYFAIYKLDERSSESNIKSNQSTIKKREILDVEIDITGNVADEYGNPLIGVNVVLKGTQKGTTTDINGDFTLLDVKENDVLIFSYVGYNTTEYTVKGNAKISIKLTENINTLDEAVVVGYQSEHKREVTASVTSINSKDLEYAPVVNVASLIATQTTGVQGITLSGAPGGRGNLVIRGNTSIGGNLSDVDAFSAYSNPLYVIDGVQTSLEDLAGYNVSNQDFLASLNPNDIERIDILKDASAAAIYGSRGANGVIIITTKQGQALAKPEFQFNVNFGMTPKPNLIPFYMGSTERNVKLGMLEKWWNHESRLDDSTPIMLTDSLNPAFNNAVDYQGLFYRNAFNQRYNLSMRGGSQSTNYRVSLGYDDNEGTVIGTGFDRYTVSANLNSSIGKKFNNRLITRFVFTDNQTSQGNPWRGYGSDERFDLDNVLPVNPQNLNSSLFAITEDQIAGFKNELESKKNTDRTFNSTVSNFAQLEVFDGFQLNSQLTFVYDNQKMNFYEPSVLRSNNNGYASYQSFNRINLSTDSYLSYLKSFGLNNITFIAGQKIDYNQYETLKLRAVGKGSDAIQVINGRYAVDQTDAFSDISENALLSYFGRLSYNFDRKYLFSANFSLDGSSRFGEDSRWAKFPSLSVGWVFSEEQFVKNWFNNIFDYGKLKFSWGINGKQFSQNYLRFGSYDLGYSGTPFGTNQMKVSTYSGINTVTPNYNSIGNKNLSWESSRQWNIGAEVDMFKSRLSLAFDAYNKNTDRLFFDVEFPHYSGYNTAKTNVAGVLNYGWELDVKYHVFPRRNKLRLMLNAAVSHNENYVSKLPNGNRDYIGNNYGYVVGRPINLYKMFIVDYILDDLAQLPVNPYTGEILSGKSAWAPMRPGIPVYKDLNGDFTLNEVHDLKLSYDYSPVPDLIGAFNINLQYGGWYLQAYSQFSFGADIRNDVLRNYLDSYDRGGDNWARKGLTDLSHLQFWEKPGDGQIEGVFPALFPAGGGLQPYYAFRPTETIWIDSGDYWKLTNLAIGHNFDEKSPFLKKMGVSRLRIYATAFNLYQWQKSKRVVDASMVNAKGFVFGNGYPQSPTFNFGFDLKF